MTWTAELLSVNQNGVSPVSFTVQYSNGGGKSFTKDYARGVPVGTFLEDQVAAEIKYLAVIDADVTTATAKIGHSITPTPDVVVKPPTQDQIDANNFFAMKIQLEAQQIAIANGLLAADDQTYTDLVVAYKTAFKIEYTTDLRWK